MRYQVIVLRRAQFDVESIAHWIGIERESPQGAARWLQAFRSAIVRLADHPNGYPLALENDSVEYTIRQFLFRTKRGLPYRGVFTIVDDEVRILRVRGPGQPPLGSEELSA